MLQVSQNQSGLADLPRPAVFALALTQASILIPVLLLCIAAVVFSELTIRTEGHRFLVQTAILLCFVALLAVSVWGFFIPFYIPDVHID